MILTAASFSVSDEEGEDVGDCGLDVLGIESSRELSSDDTTAVRALRERLRFGRRNATSDDDIVM